MSFWGGGLGKWWWVYIHVIDFTALSHDLRVGGIRRLVCFISVRVIGRANAY